MFTWMTLLTLAPLIFASAYARKVYPTLEPTLRKLSWYIFISLAIQIISTLLWYQKLNNLPIAHLYTIVGFLLVSNFYAEALKPWISKGKFRFVAIVFVFFAIVNSIFFQSIHRFPMNTYVAESIVVTGFAFLALISNPSATQKINVISLRWVHWGFLIYHVSRIALYGYGETLNLLFDSHELTWQLLSFTTTGMIVCFCIAFWKREPRTESPEKESILT